MHRWIKNLTCICLRRRVWNKKSRNIVTSLRPVLICVWCHLTLARATSAHVCGTSVVLGPWYSVRVLIQYSVVTFRATSMADTDIDGINNKRHVQCLSCDRSTGSCICPCRQNITDMHKRHIHDPALLSQDRNCTFFFFFFSKFSFMMCGVQYLRISPLKAQFTTMAANKSEKAFCVLTFHEYRSVTIFQQQFHTKFGKQPPNYKKLGVLFF